MEVSRDRGRVVVVGAESLHVQRGPFFAKELTFTVARAYGPGRYDEQYEVQGIDYPIGYVRWTEHRNMDEFLRLVSEQSVRVLPLITHELPADRAADAYDLLRTQPQHALGVLLRFAAA